MREAASGSAGRFKARHAPAPTHTGLRGRSDALNFGGGWHSHLAVLERRIRGEGVEDFWALHAKAEALMAEMLPEDGGDR